MQIRFSGQIAANTPSREPVPPTDAVAVRFPHGFLAAHAPVEIFEAPDALCLAIGEPRFPDPVLARTAAQSGIAAAWLEAFRTKGRHAPEAAHGRFAVAIIHPTSREAWLATDRFGSWPICYTEKNGTLGFSDRADGVPGQSRTIAAQAIFDYLYFHAIPAPRTIFEGVRRLPAGHVLKWGKGVLECTPWWQPTFDDTASPDLADSKARFMQIIEDAVSREAAGHQAGCFLSGGTDSSTVTGMLCKVQGRPAKCYSIGFDASGYDEMEYARIAAKHFGAEHHEYYVTPDDLLKGIPTVATHYDQPFGNSSAVPAWICASRARDDGIDKLLAGDGGDELFGGNTRYAKQRVFGWYENVPGLLRTALLQPALALPGMDRIPLIKKGVSYVEQARVPMPDRMQMYNMLLRLGMETLFEPAFIEQVNVDQPLIDQRATWQAANTTSLVNRMLAYDWKYTLADNDLPKVIGTTQLAGVDVGFPLLSDELLAFSTTLPPAWKLKNLTLRWFFKESLRGFLPDAILTKKKHGFGLPFGIWATRHAGLKALARDALDSFATRGIVRPAFIREVLDTHLPAHPGYYGEMVWILMMMEFWMRDRADSTLRMTP
ncbi:asparagine synthase [Azoarcus sp. L1K30]|uniref:asparagine synthetase B family protein n=1 Tax=Azoarcus sp. L1K30 TaxID=2820277 RepID=UPI001B83770B|nr:asparagine synthase C-terminal domain-containing protein [Azoarcus sp. L1K30]MBR0568598.1 asparagine synthase [Azoarcus sp. L1K30]